MRIRFNSGAIGVWSEDRGWEVTQETLHDLVLGQVAYFREAILSPSMPNPLLAEAEYLLATFGGGVVEEPPTIRNSAQGRVY